jgi:hypothetical protein
MATTLGVAAQADQDPADIRIEAASMAPVTAPRLDPAKTSTTSLPSLSLEGAASTVSSTSTTAPQASTVPTTTLRRYFPDPTPTDPEDPTTTEPGPITIGTSPTTTQQVTTTTTTTTTSTTTTTIPPTTTIEETTTTTIDPSPTTTDGS